MKRIFSFFLLLLLLLNSGLFISRTAFSQTDSIRLIFDEPKFNNTLPRNFRMCSGGLEREHKETPDTSGLNSLNISGSSEFSNENLPLLIKKINSKRLIDIDLRQETHGFVNGIDVSWYGKYDWADVGLTREQVLKLEKHKLDSLQQIKIVTVTRVIKKEKSTDTFLEFKDTSIEVASVKQEEELAKDFGVEYFRITATDHRQPLVSDVDLFIGYVTRLTGDYWIHFHCHAGDGRTTTFMVMYDMMKNAKNVSFEDIIARQYLIGGINLTKDEDFPSYDKQYAIERTSFLKGFYDYCKTNNDNFKTSYEKWLNR